MDEPRKGAKPEASEWHSRATVTRFDHGSGAGEGAGEGAGHQPAPDDPDSASRERRASDLPSGEPTLTDGHAGTVPTPESIAPHFPQLDIIETIGRGGMGIVYKARQKGLDRLVALKILPPDADRGDNFAERFAREARALARLSHPNIVMVHDSGQAGDLFYFIMEYVDGVNLREMMAGGKLDPKRTLAIVPPLCDGLQYAHDEGVMHRDIKPENIMIDGKGRVKIADFGLAKLIAGKTRTDYTLTAPQQVMGTMHYMAPEQIERPSDVDHRADIYALGVVLYEMLTGELPIGRFPMPSERAPVDDRVDAIVHRTLEKDPDRRYQRASEVRTDVERLSGALATPPSVPPSIPTVPPAIGTFPPANPMTRLGLASFPMKDTGTAYLCWLLCLFGACGIHRMYAGKWITGILWLLTGGLLFIGQFIDVLLIPGMVRVRNLESALARELAVQAEEQPPGSEYR